MIDPSQSVSAYLNLIVPDLSFDCATSISGSKELLEKNSYTLIFISWEQDGCTDFLREFSDEDIVTLAHDTSPDTIKEMYQKGVRSLIKKPFSKRRLQETISYYMQCNLSDVISSSKSSSEDIAETTDLMKTKSIKVLFCEDDPGMIDLIKEELKDLGRYDPHFASDGIKGQKLLQEERFDALITDIVMPNMNGLELIEWVRNSELNNLVPIFILSGSMDAKIDAFAKSWVIEIFRKPFDIADILNQIHLKLFPSGEIPEYNSSLIDYWYETVFEIFTSNLGDCGFGTLALCRKIEAASYIHSSIALHGSDVRGRILITCDERFTKDFLKEIFQGESKSEAENIENYIGELCNQLAGRLKLKLEAHGINLQITVPETSKGLCKSSLDDFPSHILSLQIQGKRGQAKVYISISKIVDDIFKSKTKDVVLDGGLFF